MADERKPEDEAPLVAMWQRFKARRIAPGVTVGGVLLAFWVAGQAMDFVRGWQAGRTECAQARASGGTCPNEARTGTPESPSTPTPQR